MQVTDAMMDAAEAAMWAAVERAKPGTLEIRIDYSADAWRDALRDMISAALAERRSRWMFWRKSRRT